VPGSGDWFFTPCSVGLRALRLDGTGRIRESGQITLDGPPQAISSRKSTLHILSGAGEQARIKSLKVTDPGHPEEVSDIPLPSGEFFQLKNRYLWAGSSILVGKYSLGDGIPVCTK
jgi:hypothetical protein